VRAIQRVFEAQPRRIYTPADLNHLVQANWEIWGFEPPPAAESVIDYLLARTRLRRIALKSKYYGSITRYTWGPVRPFELAASLRPSAYFTHETALYLNGLWDGPPRRFFLNREQSAKPRNDNALDPERMRHAFSVPQRISHYRYVYQESEFVLLSGKHTDKRDVMVRTGPHRMSVRVTGLERTLVDCVVRPEYAGGPRQVLSAFRRAQRTVSLRRLVTTLRALDHLYPYHQALGFYLERTGTDPKKLGPLRRLGFEHEFYLAHAMKDSRFDDNWRIFYPENL
jgi:hypothetical protein